MPLANLSLTCLYVAIGGYLASLLFSIFKKKRPVEVMFLTGFLFHTLSQISRGWFIGIFTPNAMVEENFFLPWCVAFLTMGLRLFKKEMDLIYTSLIPILFFLSFTFILPKGILPPLPYVQTIFSPLYFLFEVMAHACFALGAWFSILYLCNKVKTGIFHSFIIWGFVIYSAAQIIGAIWCYLGWATLFNWSERHLQSATLWCYFAAYLHLRFLPSWDMKRKAWFFLAGFFLVFFFSYLGVLREVGMPRIGG
jgi:ABC-type transport system involved in cytochrome c biogenesis permease subunit